MLAKDQNGATIFQSSLGNWYPIAGNSYEFEINYDLTNGATRVFIDGVQKGNTLSNTGVRSSNIRLLRIGKATNKNDTTWSANFKIDNLLVFSSPQHTSDYTPGYTVPEADYIESVITLPDFVYSGVGTIQSLDSFYSADFDDIHYTIEGKYYDGNSWVVSDNSYSQSNSYSVINDNINFLNVIGKDKISVKAIFPNSNDQGMINYITIGYTGQHYFVGETSITPTSSFRTDRIDSIKLISTSNIRIILLKNSVKYYYDSATSSWKQSNGTYIQANDISDLVDDVLNKLIEKNVDFKWEIIFNSNGNDIIGVDNLEISYSFAGPLPSLRETRIYGFYYDAGTPKKNVKITVSMPLLVDDDGLISKGEYVVYTDGAGYWEIAIKYGSRAPSILFWEIDDKKVVTNFITDDYVSFGSLHFI